MSEHYLTKTAAFVFLEKDGKFFYLRRLNTGWNDGRLTVPAGHVDQGESVKQAAVREAKEEAGVLIREEDLEFVQAQFLVDRYSYFYFKTSRWEGEPHVAEPNLASEGLWVPVHETRDDLIPYLHVVLDGMKKGIFYADVQPDSGD